MSDSAPKWARLTQNETNPGLFSDQTYWTLIWKSPEFVLYGANLTHFGAKSKIPAHHSPECWLLDTIHRPPGDQHPTGHTDQLTSRYNQLTGHLWSLHYGRYVPEMSLVNQYEILMSPDRGQLTRHRGQRSHHHGNPRLLQSSGTAVSTGPWFHQSGTTNSLVPPGCAAS